MARFSLRCIAAGLALIAGAALAGDPCRPLVRLNAGEDLSGDFKMLGGGVRLEAKLARDLVLPVDPSLLGLEKGAGAQPPKRAGVVLRRVLGYDDLTGDRGSLRFEDEKAGHVTVRNGTRTFRLYYRDGRPISADGTPLELAPPMFKETKFVLAPDPDTKVRANPAGGIVLLSGSKLEFGRPAGDPYEFRLVSGVRLDETAASKSPQRLEVIRPLRAAAAGTLTVLVGGMGLDFRNSRLNFCFDVHGGGAGRQAIISPNAKFVSQTGDSARFEVRVPNDIARLWQSEAAKDLGIWGGQWGPTLGLPSIVRVLGYDDERVVVDASGRVAISDARIAVLIGIGMLLMLFAASRVWLASFNPFAIIGALVRGGSSRYSLSNLQVLMWTVLVIFALAFNWSTTGELLEISQGILVLLGIAGGTSVLTRTLSAQAPATPHASAGPAEATIKNMFVSDEGGFDLLRFQMLGFTIFTWLYALGSVLRNQGLPEIPESLYWLMGISNGTYLGGKVPGALQSKADASGVAAEGLSDAEKKIPISDLKKAQAALGVAQSGVIDDATRAAVVKFKLDQGIVPANGRLDRMLLEKIESTVQ